MKSAVVLTAHGTVEKLDDLAPFIANIRRGHAPPPAIVEEVRRRYEAIGGQSPLLDHTRMLAKKVEVVPWVRPVARSYMRKRRRPLYSWPIDRRC